MTPRTTTGQLAERVARLELAFARLERALGESLYVSHGHLGLSSLTQQAPAAAQVLAGYLTGTEPRNDKDFVGRQEKAIADKSDQEHR